MEKKEHGKEFLFFCRNLEVIPQDSWNWKAKKRNTKRNAQPRGGEAGAPGGKGIAHVNGQAAAVAALAAEEEEEGAADRDGDRAADGDGGPVAHGNRKDSDGSATPRAG